jgi:hypothetical protein
VQSSMLFRTAFLHPPWPELAGGPGAEEMRSFYTFRPFCIRGWLSWQVGLDARKCVSFYTLFDHSSPWPGQTGRWPGCEEMRVFLYFSAFCIHGWPGWQVISDARVFVQAFGR